MTLTLEELQILVKNLNEYLNSKKQLSFEDQILFSTLKKINKTINIDFKIDCENFLGKSKSDFLDFPFSLNYDNKDIISRYPLGNQTEFNFN